MTAASTWASPSPTRTPLQEFKIQTSTYDATYGRNPGGERERGHQVRHQHLARHGLRVLPQRRPRRQRLLLQSRYVPHDFAAAVCPKQVLNQNQYGGVIGGPIKKDKLFIFGSYQGTGPEERREPGGQFGNHRFTPSFLPATARPRRSFQQLIAGNCELPSFGPPGRTEFFPAPPPISQPGCSEHAAGQERRWQLLLPHAQLVWRSDQLQHAGVVPRKANAGEWRLH